MSLINYFDNTPGIEIEKNRDLKLKSTLSLNSTGDLITIRNLVALKKVIKTLNSNNVKYRILGNGSNQILPSHSQYPYLKLDFYFDRDYLSEVREKYILPASVPLNILTSHAIRFGIKGWEVFTGIPATIGGAVFMNAGTNLGEIGGLVEKVKIVTVEGEERVEIMKAGSFAYRMNNFLQEGEVIFEVHLNSNGVDKEISKLIKSYLEFRTKTQPLGMKNCGCVFKNHLPGKGEGDKLCQAGKFIDILGLKGFTSGDLRISPIHGNFIENLGNSNSDEFKDFLGIIKKELKLQFGIEFEPEIKF